MRFPSLHLNFLFKSIIGNIASVVGTPLFMDKAITSLEKLAYARCFIEILANKALQKLVKLDIKGEEIVQTAVKYEWLPTKCNKCNTLCHTDNYYLQKKFHCLRGQKIQKCLQDSLLHKVILVQARWVGCSSLGWH